ncbi:MAG: hydrogenase maturation protease [Anaerolineales bacterium]
MEKNKTTLVIGLGNPILGDDGVGWRIVEQVEEADVSGDKLTELKVEFDYLSLGGLSLMERMNGYKNVVLIDSITTGSKPNGTIYSLPLSSLPDFSSGHTTAIHDTSLATALEVGKRMGMVLPEEVWVVAVEAEQVFDFSEEMSPSVEASVPYAVEIVMDILIHNIREEKIYDLT